MPDAEYLSKCVYSSPGMYVNDESKSDRYDGMIDNIQDLLPPPANMLDYGSGLGVLAKKLSDLGYHVECYEPSKYARDISRCGLKTHSRVCDIPKSAFNMVIAIEVLEHCINPLYDIGIMHECLANGGLFYYTTGLFDDFFRMAKYVQPEQHLNFFTKNSMETALSNAGFKFDYHDGMAFPVGVKNV